MIEIAELRFGKGMAGIASERDLDAADDDLFVLSSDLAGSGAAAAEIALVVIEHQLDVAVQIPICSHAPGANL